MNFTDQNLNMPKHNLNRSIVFQQIFANYMIETEIIVASIRHTMHVVETAMIGADIATIPFKVIEQMMKHPLTDKGIDSFLNDWKKVKNR